jgi:glutamine synthetase
MATQSALGNVLKRIIDEKINLIKFQWLGNDLIPRAMVSHAEFLREHMRDGIGIPKALQSFNVLDKLAYEGSWGSEASELKIMPDPTTYSPLPYAPGSARMMSELCGLDLKPHPTDARFFLRRMIGKAQEMGYSPMASCETEFYVLERGVGGSVTPYVNTKFATSHSYDLYNDYVQEVVSNLATMGIHVERLKKEYGHAQVEPILRYTDALGAADAYVALKDVAKGVAAKRGLFASFMPKPYSGLPGSGCHIHLSLFDLKTKRNAFYDPNDRRGCKLSKVGYGFIGGIMAHMNGICVFGASISNSYKRLLPGSWAPAHVCYGYDHRGAAIRIPSISPHSDGSAERIEWRVPDPACNPYYAIGMLLAAGLAGIEKNLDPGDPLTVDPARFSEQELESRGILWLPRTVGEAIAEAKKDPFAKETLGEMAFREFIKVRESEWRDYREQVTPWEVDSYLTSL